MRGTFKYIQPETSSSLTFLFLNSLYFFQLVLLGLHSFLFFLFPVLSISVKITITAFTFYNQKQNIPRCTIHSSARSKPQFLYMIIQYTGIRELLQDLSFFTVLSQAVWDSALLKRVSEGTTSIVLSDANNLVQMLLVHVERQSSTQTHPSLLL